jgi:hypothetical protein
MKDAEGDRMKRVLISLSFRTPLAESKMGVGLDGVRAK